MQAYTLKLVVDDLNELAPFHIYRAFNSLTTT